MMTTTATSFPIASLGPAQQTAGAVNGAVAITLRVEAALALSGAALAYGALGGSWLMFAVLFLLPDLSMLGYYIDRRWGAAIYNAGHSYVAPALLALAGAALAMPTFYGTALIWTAHIGFDRLLGYGLKYGDAFWATHLGWRGKQAATDKSI